MKILNAKVTDLDVSYLSGKSVLLAGYLAIHNIERLRDYLLSKAHRVGFTGATTFNTKGIRPQCTLYEKGKPVKVLTGPPRLKAGVRLYKGALPIAYFIHFLSFVWSAIRLGMIFDIYIGVSYVPALSGLLLKRMGLARSVVYYSYDYAPTPPSANVYTVLTTRMFQIVDGICARHSDVTWNLSKSMIRIREKISPCKTELARQIVVPYSISSRWEFQTRSNIYRSTVGFVGNLVENQGLELVIEATAEIVKTIPDFRVLIIGSGPREGVLKELVREKALEKHLVFLGFVRDENEVYRILSSCSAGIAPYVLDPYSLVNYAYPGKVRVYIECGLPVIMTRISDTADEIERFKAGYVIRYNRYQLTNAIVKLLSDDALYQEFRRNVRTLASKNRVEDILDVAFTLSRERLCQTH